VRSSDENRAVNYSEVQLNGETATKTMPCLPVLKGVEMSRFFEEKKVGDRLVGAGAGAGTV
jgi:hypothetical protein